MKKKTVFIRGKYRHVHHGELPSGHDPHEGKAKDRYECRDREWQGLSHPVDRHQHHHVAAARFLGYVVPYRVLAYV